MPCGEGVPKAGLNGSALARPLTVRGPVCVSLHTNDTFTVFGREKGSIYLWGEVKHSRGGEGIEYFEGLINRPGQRGR